MVHLALLAVLSAQAESWCAYPLHVHEWGVQVFSAEGQPRPPVDLPAWFHREGVSGQPPAEPVRALPADSGVRTLPLVWFHAPVRWADSVPVAFEVGFSQGDAAVWYPQADLRRPADTANSPDAQRMLRRLEEQRAARGPFTGLGGAPLPGDPRAQLAWERLDLSAVPLAAPHPTEQTWVEDFRALDALWVNRGPESERFLFYEAETRERPALRVERGSTWGPDRPHYLLHNDSPFPVHDVYVLAEGGAAGFWAPQIPAGASAGFLLDRPGPEDVRAHLRQTLVDHAQPAPSPSYSWAGDDCVMGRDPAVPVTEASGHRLYAAEVDAILGVWEERLFGAEGTVILYREDPAALAELMPVGVYTDMFHFVDLRRLGLVLWEGLELDEMTGS
jgi:hypothetical protein